MAMGKARKIDNVASMTVSGNPPQRSVRTSLRPKLPPPMRTKNTARMPTQRMASQGFQNQRMQLSTRPPTIRLVASRARHCSSNG